MPRRRPAGPVPVLAAGATALAAGVTALAAGATALAAGLTVMAAALVAVPAGAATTTSTSVTTTTSPAANPKALLAASLAAARSQPSVHFVAVSTVGKQSVAITADVARAKGREAVVVTGGQQTGHVAVRLVHQAAYFRGDPTGLEGYLGMPSTLATKYAGTWIRFDRSNPTYQAISKSLTVSSAVSQISVKAPLANGPSATVDGVPAVSVTGTTTDLGGKGPAALYLPARSRVLPLQYTAQGTQKAQGSKKQEKASGQVDFSHWGERFAVAAPATSVSASSL